MSRPLRIDYPGAYYHVMNQGLTGQKAFVSGADFEGFLTLIEDAWRRWDIRVFSYCLMDTHYHLALQTPHGNLQRIMRHIDGVYTQRFNRLHKGDGPFPAIVKLPFSGGLNKYATPWAERLTSRGYCTLLVDSFTPRGVKSIAGRPRLVLPWACAQDAYDAKSYLVGLPFVDRNRIAAMGWSHGGMSIFQAIKKRPSSEIEAIRSGRPSLFIRIAKHHCATWMRRS